MSNPPICAAGRLLLERRIRSFSQFLFVFIEKNKLIAQFTIFSMINKYLRLGVRTKRIFYSALYEKKITQILSPFTLHFD